MRHICAGLILACCGLMALVLIPVAVPLLVLIGVVAILAMVGVGLAVKAKRILLRREP